jgi:ABC-2 type transport system permease protein
MTFFSGFIIPVRFFPSTVQTVANATPFPAVLQRPVDVFVGKTNGVDVFVTLAVQAGWALALGTLALATFAAGARRLVVQGG